MTDNLTMEKQFGEISLSQQSKFFVGTDSSGKTAPMEIMYVGNAPKELTEKALRLQAEKMRKKRAVFQEETRRTNFKYYCSICLIIRDENDYLEEWLKWHIGQGVEHFYIYDHGSKQPVIDFVQSLGTEISDKVTVMDWSGRHADAQPEAYNDCLKRYRGESRWIGYIDVDEQVRIKTGQSLPAFLRGYEEYAALFAVWLTYNANGRRYRTNETLRERFTNISRADEGANYMGKVFVQPIYMSVMVIHNGRAEDGFGIADEHKQRVKDYSLSSENGTTDLICVDHYYTKSYEEWLEKMRRGSGHAKYQRKYSDFFKVNPDMEYCREEIDICQQYEQF